MTNQAPFVGPGTLVVVVEVETVSRLVLVLVELMVVVGGNGFSGGNLYAIASSGGGGLYVGAIIGGGGIGGPGLARFRYRAISSGRGGPSCPSLALRSRSTLIWLHTRRNSVVAVTALAASSMFLAIPLLPSLNSSSLISVRTCWNSSDRR